MLKIKISILFCLLLCIMSVTAQTKKRLYIANDDHTDYMWSGDEAQYDSAFVKTLDFHLRKIDSTRSELPDFQNRYNCDGSYWLRAYQKYRSPEQFNRLMAAIRSGHISSQLNSVVSTFGAQPAEAVIRGMYYAGHLERKHDVRFTMASTMENNTIPLGLSSLWAGAGAKYSWKGIGGYGSQLSYASRAKRKHPLYRYQGLDGSSVLMKWYPYNEKDAPGLGGYAECRMDMKSRNIPVEIMTAINMLDNYCDTISTSSKYPYNVAGAFGYGHDDLQTFVSDPFINGAKKGSNAKRSVRVSNEEDFFQDIERTYPQRPIKSVSFGNEWDLLCASMNETTAEVRRSTENLRSAEALASIVALKQPDFANKLLPARNAAWDAFGLYWEHNWTGDGPVSNKNRGLWQEKLKNQLKGYVDSLYQLSLNTLGTQLQQSKHPRYVVFNPLSWVRNDVADLPFSGNYAFKVIDVQTGYEVPSQLIDKNGKKFVRIAASGIPSVGYKVYEIRKGKPKALPLAASVQGGIISNKRYQIRLTPSGVITEIHDKKSNRQLVKLTDGKYLNDLGASDLNNGSPLQVENSGPVSVTLKAVSTHPVPHTVRLTLFADNPRIELENSIDANFKDVKTWAFSFDMKNPTTHHEEVGAILKVKKESKGGHYSDEIARYDWQTFNHFANVSNGEYGITLSNVDCSFFKLGKSTIDSLWDGSSQISALAGGRVDKKVEDGGTLGIHDQLGQQKFNYRFAIVPQQGKFDAVHSMKVSLEHQNALSSTLLTGGKNADSAASFSLISVNNPNVVLWGIKPSEDGISKGLISRFWNLKDEKVLVGVSLYKPLKAAAQTSHIETDLKKLNLNNSILNMMFNPQQLNSYRLIMVINN